MISSRNTRNIGRGNFHLLPIALPNSTYYDIKVTNMENIPKFRPNPNLKLMDQVREVLRYHHYAYRTEQTYCQWILRYIHYFGGKTHPRLLGEKDIEAVHRVLSVMEGKTDLMAKLIYGSGLRLMECIRLRVQDMDFGQSCRNCSDTRM